MTDEAKIKLEQGVLEASDEESARKYLETQLRQAEQHLQALPAEATDEARARIYLEKSNALLGLERNEEAWNEAKRAFDIFIEQELWPETIEACDILYQTEQPASILALAHGVWLSITYPVDPEQTIVMLSYVVDETPADSDGAAVAAATAHYIVGLRTEDEEKHNSLSFLTTNLIAKVAQRHGDVKSQEALDFWMEKMELKDPEVFLPRMGSILDVIVGDSWWFDRDALREKLPVN